MAQDFRAAFGLGEDDKLIGTVDADGIALPPKGLSEMMQQKAAKLQGKRSAVPAVVLKPIARRSVETSDAAS
jgi:hypothetical protein